MSQKKDLPASPKMDETVPGGRYVRNVRIVNGVYYGGEVIDADGNVLAAFADNEINTCQPRSAHADKET